MKHTFSSILLLILCAGVCSAQKAIQQAHSANVDGLRSSTYYDETHSGDPHQQSKIKVNRPLGQQSGTATVDLNDDLAQMRQGAGLNFDTATRTRVSRKKNKGTLQGYNYTRQNGQVVKMYMNRNTAKSNQQAAQKASQQTTSQPEPAEAEQENKQSQPGGYIYKEVKPLRDTNPEDAPIKTKPMPKVQSTKKAYKYIKPYEEELPEQIKDKIEKRRSQLAQKRAEEDKVRRAQRHAREKAEEEAKQARAAQEAKEKAEKEAEIKADAAARAQQQQEALKHPAFSTQAMRNLFIVKGIKPKQYQSSLTTPTSTSTVTKKPFKVPADQVQKDKQLQQKQAAAAAAAKKAKAEEEARKLREREERAQRQIAKMKEDMTRDDPCNDYVRTSVPEACRRCCIGSPTMDTDEYEMTGGYLVGNECTCTYKKLDYNPCARSIRYTSDEACTECCKFRPPIDPNEFEITYGKLVENGQYCRCFWKKRETEQERAERLERERQEEEIRRQEAEEQRQREAAEQRRREAEEQRQREEEEERRRQEEEEAAEQEEQYNYNTISASDWINSHMPW